MIRHVAGIAEIVEDVEGAVRFYTETLDMEIENRHSDDYVILKSPGVLHFGIWSRAAAAEATYGDRSAIEKVPLGYTLEFEVDNVADTAATLAEANVSLAQETKTEPWGQVSCRLMSPGGSLLGMAETPWRRTLDAPANEQAE